MPKVGFTGTRGGMSEAQKAAVGLLLNTVLSDDPGSGSEFHHGDCIGADADAHRIARERGMRIVLHPPSVDKLRAFCDYDESRDPRPYIERDHVLVDEVELLIATPGGFEEELRSGTWATVRYAIKCERPTIIVYPDGSTSARGSLYEFVAPEVREPEMPPPFHGLAAELLGPRPADESIEESA
jgi:hypothetical protein